MCSLWQRSNGQTAIYYINFLNAFACIKNRTAITHNFMWPTKSQRRRHQRLHNWINTLHEERAETKKLVKINWISFLSMFTASRSEANERWKICTSFVLIARKPYANVRIRDTFNRNKLGEWIRIENYCSKCYENKTSLTLDARRLR